MNRQDAKGAESFGTAKTPRRQENPVKVKTVQTAAENPAALGRMVFTRLMFSWCLGVLAVQTKGFWAPLASWRFEHVFLGALGVLAVQQNA